MSQQVSPTRRALALSTLALSIGLTACSDDSNDSVAVIGADGITGSRVAIATRAADYSSGRIDMHDITTGSRIFSYPATGSDIRAASYGDDVYQLARFNMDHITKFSDDSPVAEYQYSVNSPDEDASANPYQIVFTPNNDDKAYVLRYGSDKIWVINPDTDLEAGFKLGELDISAYDTDSPNANSGVVVGDKLFVLMERLDGYSVTKQGYVAVFDTNTLTEIDTGQGTADGLMGIPVGVQNPDGLQYNHANGLLYLTGRGNLYQTDATAAGGDRFTGGIVTIDPSNYTATMLLDDGTEDDNQGFFRSSVVIDANAGYLFSYTGSFSGSSTLRRFNTTVGTMVDGSIAGLEAADLTTMSQAPNDQLWVAVNGDNPEVSRIDLNTDTVVDSFTTELVPLNFAFVE